MLGDGRAEEHSSEKNLIPPRRRGRSAWAADGGDMVRPMADGEKEAAYREVCSTFRQLDDFRAKLLGFLPLASGAGIFAILSNGANAGLTLIFGLSGALVTAGLGIH